MDYRLVLTLSPCLVALPAMSAYAQPAPLGSGEVSAQVLPEASPQRYAQTSVEFAPRGAAPQSAVPMVEFADATGQKARADYRFLIAAKNMARQAAEVQNGGLGRYRAEAAMHGPFMETPFTIGDDGSLIFTFKGYHPDDIDINGNAAYSTETVVKVMADRQFQVIYNGPVR